MNQSKGRSGAGDFLSACLCLTCFVGVGWTTRAAAAQTSTPSAKVSFEREKFTVDKRPAFIIPPTKKLAGPTPWVLYAPTLGRGLPGKAEHWMFRQFLDAGVAIAGVDVGESYGSPPGRATYNALHKRLTEKHGFARQACLLGRSRGGLMLYCWAAENPEKVKCIAGIYPVCNIASYPGLKRACGAYGLTAKQLEAELSKHNPPDRLAALAKANVPIFHIHGDVDKVVPLTANSGLLAERYKAAGGKMELRIAKGRGHNMWRGFFECRELVDFVIEQAGAAQNPLAKTIRVGGLTFDPASPPKPLVTRRDLGLVTAPAVDGRLVHESKKQLYETRATITPGGDYLLMFPEGAHYGGRKGKVNIYGKPVQTTMGTRGPSRSRPRWSTPTPRRCCSTIPTVRGSSRFTTTATRAGTSRPPTAARSGYRSRQTKAARGPSRNSSSPTLWRPRRRAPFTTTSAPTWTCSPTARTSTCSFLTAGSGRCTCT